jgi:hypothetical protein
MDELQQQNLINTYIKYQKIDEKSKEADELFWAFMEMNELIKENPELAWLLIKKILETDNSIKIIQNLSAGPLEDLLVYHGDQFIDRIEAEAKNNPDFAKLLGGVWKNEISDENWERINKVCNRSWDK